MIDSAPLLQAGQIDTVKERLAKDGLPLAAELSIS